jgi:hypothetical protein
MVRERDLAVEELVGRVNQMEGRFIDLLVGQMKGSDKAQEGQESWIRANEALAARNTLDAEVIAQEREGRVKWAQGAVYETAHRERKRFEWLFAGVVQGMIISQNVFERDEDMLDRAETLTDQMIQRVNARFRGLDGDEQA